MKLRVALPIVATVVLTLTPGVAAETFSSFGPRAMAMGRAYTSVAADPSAIYWNPSLLVFYSGKWNISWLQGSDSAEDDGFIEDLHEILTFDPEQAAGTPETAAELAERLEDLGDFQTAARESEHLAFALTHNRTGFMIVERKDVYLAALTDLENIAADGETAAGSIADNQSVMAAARLERTEFISSYSYFSQSLGMLVGLNLKYVQAKSSYQELPLWDLEPDVSLTELLGAAGRRHRSDDSAFSWDLAISAVIGSGNLSLMGRDITGYKLERKDLDELEIKPSYRLGYSTGLGKNFTIAADYDITANRDRISGQTDRTLCWGMEKWFGGEKALAVRGGFFREMGGNGAHEFVYSAGVGFRIKWIEGDVSGLMDADGFVEGISMQLKVSFE